ncbi:MAG: hypothetical protein KAY37_04365 [Phycisphaerae bacterium]|nr:hypothetical protein [Phycisphaerae bacterium]
MRTYFHRFAIVALAAQVLVLGAIESHAGLIPLDLPTLADPGCTAALLQPEGEAHGDQARTEQSATEVPSVEGTPPAEEKTAAATGDEPRRFADGGTMVMSLLLEKLSLADLTQRANSIIVGTVTGMEPRWNADQTRIYTHVTIIPDDALGGYVKGQPRDQLTLIQLGGKIGDSELIVEQAPPFVVGEKVLVFVRQMSAGPGVVGWFQGKFPVRDGMIAWSNVSLEDFVGRIGYIVDYGQEPEGSSWNDLGIAPGPSRGGPVVIREPEPDQKQEQQGQCIDGQTAAPAKAPKAKEKGAEQREQDLDELNSDKPFAPQALPAEETALAAGSSAARHEELLSRGATEIESARNTYGRYYTLPDGREAAVISSAPMHYQDVDGSYQLVDNTIVSAASGGDYAFTNGANSFRLYFHDQADQATDVLFALPTGEEIHMWAEGEVWYEDADGTRELLYQPQVTTGLPDESTILYPGRYPAVDEIFNAKYEGVKHTYLLHVLPSFVGDRSHGILEFSEVVKLPAGSRLFADGAIQTQDFVTPGDIQVQDATEQPLPLVVFPAPWAHEGTDRTFDPDHDATLGLSYRVTYLSDGRIRIGTQVPVQWLVDPERAYPVSIDPSAYYYENHSYDDCYQYGSTSFNYSAAYLKVGYHSSYGVPYYLSYMCWHNVNIPPGSTVDYVSLWWKAYNSYTNSCYWRWQFEDADNAQPCAYEYPTNRSYVSHYNYWNGYSTSWTSGSWYGVGNFASGLQDVIDRAGWSVGNNAGMKWCANTSSGSYRYLHSYDSSSSYAPYIYVEYTAPGDSCSNPQDLTSLSSPYSGTTTGYANDFDPTCGGTDTSPDRIFYYDLPNGWEISIGETSNNFDSVHELRYGATCPGGTLIQCIDDPDTTAIVWPNSTGSTQRVWFILDGYGSSNSGDFTLAWTITAPDPCDSVTSIAGCGSGYTQTYSESGSGVWSGTFCGYSVPGKERVYSFVAPTTGTYSVEVTSANGYVDYGQRASSCAETGWTCIDDISSPGTYGSMSWTSGTTYYILLDSESTSSRTHQFYINCPSVEPTITSISPTSGGAGERAFNPPPSAYTSFVTIAGSNFGSSQGANDHVLFYGYGTTYYYNDPYTHSWSGTQIENYVVPGASSHSTDGVCVYLDGTWSNKKPFEVTYSIWGYKWDDADMPVPYYYNSSSEPVSAASTAQTSVKTWQDIEGSYICHSYMGTTASPASTHGDGVNTIGWTYSTDWVGVSTIQISGTSITEADIELSTYYSWSLSGEAGMMDVQNVCTHEAGHGFVGLSDQYGVPDQPETMYGYVANGETQKRDLEPEDQDGAKWLYPAPCTGITGHWCGNYNTNWNHAKNWNNGRIADSTIDVTVLSTAANWPHVAGTYSIGALTVQSGAHLYIDSGPYYLWVYGNIANSGTIHSSGTYLDDVSIRGGGSRTITGGTFDGMGLGIYDGTTVTANSNISTLAAFYPASGSATFNSNGYTITISGHLYNDAAAINAGSSTWNIGGNYTHYSSVGTLNADTSTFCFDGGGTSYVYDSPTFYYLRVNKSGGAYTYLGSNVSAREIYVDAGRLDANGHNVTTTHDIQVEDGGTFYADSGHIDIGDDLYVRAGGTYYGETSNTDIDYWCNVYGTLETDSANITRDGNSSRTYVYDGGVLKVESGSSFTDADGYVEIDSGGELNVSGGTLDIGKELDNYGTLTVSGGTITTETLTGQTGGGVYIRDNSTLNMSAGTIYCGDNFNIYEENNMNCSGGTIWMKPGAGGDSPSLIGLYFSGGNASHFNNLKIDNTEVQLDLPSGSEYLNVDGSLSIYTGAELNTQYPGHNVVNITIAHNWTNNSTFTHNNNTVTFNGGGTQNINSDGPFYDLVIDGTGQFVYNLADLTIVGSLTVDDHLHTDYYGGGNGLDVAGAISIGASGGHLDCAASGTAAIDCGGNWSNNGTFTCGHSTVTFDGSSASNIYGSTTFYNLTANKSSATVAPAADVTVSYRTTVNSASKLDISGVSFSTSYLTLNSGGEIEVNSGGVFTRNTSGGYSGLIDINGGTFNANGSYQDQTSTAQLTVDGGAYNCAGSTYSDYYNVSMSSGTIDVGGDMWMYDTTVLNITGGTIYCGEGWNPNSSHPSIPYSVGALLVFDGTTDHYFYGGPNATFGTVHIDKASKGGGHREEPPEDLPPEKREREGEPPTRTSQLSLSADLKVTDLWVKSGSTLATGSYSVLMGSGGSLDADGTLSSSGGSITHSSSGTYAFSVDGGTLSASGTTFEYMDSNGVSVGSGGSISSINSCTFQNGASGGSLLKVSNNQTLTPTGTAWTLGSASYNVYKTNDSGEISLCDATGLGAGEAYDNDLYDRVHWAPVAPSSASSNHNNFCAGDYSTIELSVSGGSGTTVRWFDDSCGGNDIGTGSPLTIASPTTTTTYHARWETSACGNSSCASIEVTVNPLPGTPTSGQANPTWVCPSGSADISASVGGGETIDWYTGSCGGSLIGTGNPLTVYPSTTTTYYGMARDTTTGCESSSCVTVTVDVDTGDPWFTFTPPNVDQNADAGGCDALVTINSATADDAYDTSVAVTYERSDNPALTLSDPFPQGTTTVTWTATDDCSHTATHYQTVIISNQNELVFDVKLRGVASVTRCITFTLYDCDGYTKVVEDELTFDSNGEALGVLLTVDCGDYDCILAQDELHSLARQFDRGYGFNVVNKQYVASFTGTSDLIHGDLYDDNLVDIVDFGTYIAEWGWTGDPNTTCATPWPHADISGDAAIGTADFAFIHTNFLSGGEGPCCGLLGYGEPLESITVRELRSLGLGHLERADLNEDGVLDLTDIQLYLDGVLPEEIGDEASDEFPVDPADPAGME